MTQTQLRPARPGLLGRDAGPFGRVLRLLLGLAAVGAAGWLAVDGDLSVAGWVVAGLLFGLTALAYLAAVWLLGPRLLGRIGPWPATTLFLTPAVAVVALPGIPAPVRIAVILYYGVSLVVIALIGYGGCEVVGIPMAVLRRRDVIYCPLNVVDAVEHPLASRPGRAGALVAGLLAAVGAAYFVAADQLAGGQPAGGPLGLPFEDRWLTVLFVPAAVALARDAWRARAAGLRVALTTGSGLGALTLAAATGTIVVAGSVGLFLTAVLALMLAGGVAAAIRRLAGR